MSDLDPNGLEAAADAYSKVFPNWLSRDALRAAIRAYEAHKASAVPDDEVERVWKALAFAYMTEDCFGADPEFLMPEVKDRHKAAAHAAIAAMRPSAVPDDLPLSDPRHPESISSFLPPAVPDEVNALVSQLRWSLGRDMNTEDMRRRAADLLEQKAREIEELKDALENAVVRLRITQELAQQLADLKTPPNRNE